MHRNTNGLPSAENIKEQSFKKIPGGPRSRRASLSDWRPGPLWAEEPGSAPADRISIGVKCDRSARPIAARAPDGTSYRVTRVGHVSGLHHVSGAVAVGDGAAYDGTGNNSGSDTHAHCTAEAARFCCRRRRQQRDRHCRGSGKCEQSLVHCGRLLNASVEPTTPWRPPAVNFASDFEQFWATMSTFGDSAI